MESKMSDSTSHPAGPDKFCGVPARGTRRHRWSGALFLLIILAVAGCHRSGSSGGAAAGAPSTHGGRGGGMGPTMVSTAKAEQGDIGVYVYGLGVVTPLNTVSVNSRVEGQIMKVYFQEGQMVKAGAPLLDIDPGPDQAALLVAKGELERDKALLEDAKLDLQRYQLDTQVATVHQDEGTVELDQGNLDSAQVQLNYCHITSPISGRVGLRLVDPGNIVQAGSTNLVIVSQLQPISVIFTLPEDDLPQIQKQLRAGNQLEVDAYDRALQNKLANGTLETLDNQIDPTTGTVKFRAIFTNDDESLFPNQFVNARLLVDTLEDATLLPNTVIQRNSDTAYVYILEPDDTGTNQAPPVQTGTNQPVKMQVVKMQTITTSTTDGNVTAVEGIDPGTVVVADNFNKLADGVKVIVRPANGGAGHRRKSAAQ
jgi:multidrug efflux system membrane fusion protein